MKRALWTDDGIDVDEVDPPALPDRWVRIAVDACGICGSDLHFLHGDYPRAVWTSPGHEFAMHVVDGPAGLPDVRYAVTPRRGRTGGGGDDRAAGRGPAWCRARTCGRCGRCSSSRRTA